MTVWHKQKSSGKIYEKTFVFLIKRRGTAGLPLPASCPPMPTDVWHSPPILAPMEMWSYCSGLSHVVRKADLSSFKPFHILAVACKLLRCPSMIPTYWCSSPSVVASLKGWVRPGDLLHMLKVIPFPHSFANDSVFHFNALISSLACHL